MFGSAILDVAIGVIFAFLCVSLVASVVTEAISTISKWREKTLLDGLKALLNDAQFTGVVRDLYNHALVNPLGTGKAQEISQLTHMPAYIDSKQFAVALLDHLNLNPAASGAGTNPTSPTVQARLASISTAINAIPDLQLRRAIDALWRTALDDEAKFSQNIALWFDQAMDRLSGWYKRRTQLVTFLVALGVAGVFNVNVLYEARQIWKRPAVISELKLDPKDSQAIKSLENLEGLDLIGWRSGPAPTRESSSILLAVLSWFLVAGSTLFGAAFWFDALKNVVQLRGTGIAATKAKKPAKA